jgi:putative transcriptional regulator
VTNDLFPKGQRGSPTRTPASRESATVCIPPVPAYTRTQVTKIRRKAKCSQAAFGIFLNVGKSNVVAWEQGTKKPRGPAARLLDIVDRKGIQALL